MDKVEKVDNEQAISKQNECVDRVDADYEETHWAWAHFWGMNGRTEEERKHYVDSVNRLQLGSGSNALRQIFAKETILGIFRLTDSGDDVQNLTTIAGELKDPSVISELIKQSEQWVTSNPTEECTRLINNFINASPHRWNNHGLDKNVLIEYREKYRDLRNARLAHLLINDRTFSPNDTEITEVLNFLGHRIDEIHSFILGVSNSFDWENNIRTNICTNLWDAFQDGVLISAESSYPGFESDKDQTR